MTFLDITLLLDKSALYVIICNYMQLDIIISFTYNVYELAY